MSGWLLPKICSSAPTDRSPAQTLQALTASVTLCWLNPDQTEQKHNIKQERTHQFTIQPLKITQP
jgi:hypothetical protein